MLWSHPLYVLPHPLCVVSRPLYIFSHPLYVFHMHPMLSFHPLYATVCHTHCLFRRTPWLCFITPVVLCATPIVCYNMPQPIVCSATPNVCLFITPMVCFTYHARLRVSWYYSIECFVTVERLEVTYSYWDGSGHRREIVLNKGITVGECRVIVYLFQCW